MANAGASHRAIALAAQALLPAALLAASAAAAGPAPGDETHWALLSDGSEVAGNWRDLRDWDERRKLPALGGKWLLDRANHVRLLRDMTARPRLDGPAVFFANGDVLPGRVIGWYAADSSAALPARLAVMPADPIATRAAYGSEAERRHKGALAVRADCVSRIVLGRRRPEMLEGGALFFADGRRRSVTAVRWMNDGVRALAEEGVVAARFAELAEVQVPGLDVTAAVLADSAAPSVGEDGWLCRAETAEGAVLTFAQALCEERRGRYGSRDTAVHRVRPTWALSPLDVPDAAMAVRSWRKATEVPLSLLPAETLAQKSFTGFVWPWRRNRSIRGQTLQAGPYSSDLGVGTHSYSEVAFALPPGARQFTCLVGLDAAVGTGGCVRCRILRDGPTGPTLWSGPTLVGTGKPLRAGPMDVTGAAKLVLVTDFAHDGRPDGADPADIRDEVDWLLPLVTVDGRSLAAARADAGRWVPALDGWKLTGGKASDVRLGVVRLSSYEWVTTLDVPPGGLAFSRRVRPSVAAALLDADATGAMDGNSQVVELLVDGRAVEPAWGGAGPIRTRDRGRGQSNWRRWSLQDHFGREVVLTMRLRPDERDRGGRGLVWRGLAVLPQVEGLGSDGRLLVPDVPLVKARPIEVVWFPQTDGRRRKPTEPPAPATAAVWGLNLPNSYVVSSGLTMTFELAAQWRRFVAVVGSENRHHRGPFVVGIDGKERWRSDDETLRCGRCQQVDVPIPPGAKTITLQVVHDMTSGVWGQAGFVTGAGH